MAGYATMGFAERAVTMPVWDALAAADRPMSVADLHIVTAARPSSIHKRVTAWWRAGFVDRTQTSPGRFVMSEQHKAQSKPPIMAKHGVQKRTPTDRQKLWSAMRVLKRFDLPTLEIASGASHGSAQSYVNYLVNAGYIRMLDKGCSRRGEHASYFLKRRSGPKAPRINHVTTANGRRRVVIDPNDGSQHSGSPEADGARAINHVC